MMAIALIKEMKETRSLYYTSKHPVIESIFPPQWLASKENKEAEFLSRHHLQGWDYKLASTEVWKVCHRQQIWPTLDIIVSKGIHLIPR